MHRRALVPVMLLLCSLLAGPTAVGAHEPTTALPFTNARDVDVHLASGRIFVSGGNAVAVFSAGGSAVGTVTGQPGAAGMVIAGDDLFVAQSTAGAISRIDVQTLAVEHVYPLGVTVSGTLGMAGGRLWLGSGGDQWGDVASLDPATGEVDVHLEHVLYRPSFAEGPVDSDVLVAWNAGLSPSTLYAYDVSGPDPQRITSRRLDASNTRQVAVSPDGQRLWVASGSPYRIDEHRTSDLAPTGVSYQTGAYPNAVATTPNGSGLVAGTDSIYAEDVHLFPTSTPIDLRHVDVGRRLDPSGVAVAADGTHVYAVADGALHVLDAPVTTLLAAAPLTGPTDGGTEVVLTGSGFTGTADVRFGGRPARRFEVRSDSEIVAIAPALDAGLASITVAGPFTTTATAGAPVFVPDGTLTPRGRWLHAAYEDLLGRPPTRDEVEDASARMDAGATPADVTTGLALSREARERFVHERFQAVVERPPADDRLARWSTHLLAGAPADDIEVQLLRSPEFYRSSGASFAAFVNGLYREVLGRAADPGGQQHWVDQLTRGTRRAVVAAAVVTSPESRTHQVVVSCRQFLERRCTAEERASWSAELTTWAGDVPRLRAALTGSDEYVAAASS